MILKDLSKRIKKSKPCGLVNCFINYEQFPHEHTIEDMIDELDPKLVEDFLTYMKNQEVSNE
jgi:hypothetical protein